MDSIYLDYNATSPLSQSVSDWLKSGDFHFANPSSQHTLGKASRKSINESRNTIYKIFGRSEKDTHLFFHSGATEAFSTFAYSFAEEARLRGKDLLICYSVVDHPAITTLTEKYFGPHVKLFELKRNHALDYLHEENFEALKDKKDNNPELMILYHHLWVHNETGLVSPLEALTRFKGIPDLFLHVDAVQAPGKIEDWKSLTVGDIWSFSAHKFGALKGLGFSFFKKDLALHPLITGGGQQQKLRSGTENPMGAKSIALALTDLEKLDIGNTSALRERLATFIKDELKDLGDVVSSGNSNSNTIYFYFNNLSSDIALALFDLQGLMISAGSACMSGTARASTVLTHMNLNAVAKNGLRISLPFSLSENKLQTIQAKLQSVIQKVRNQKS